jgi:hypothetical protein
MSAPAPMPDAGDVRGLLNGLLDKPVTVTRERDPVLPGRDVHVVGSYADDEGALRAVVLCDQPLGIVLGAALALVPRPRVEQALATGLVPEDLAENTREVLNVGASLFNSGAAHLKLSDTWVVPQPVGDDVVGFLRVPCQRADLRVDVPGYGEGVLAVLLR